MPGYVWNGSSWRTFNGIYAWDGSVWKTINSGWAWDGSSWRQIYSSGTFFPVLRIPGNTGTLTRRSVGLNIELYRGSTATGTYSYQFQYAVGEQANWSNQTGTNNSGTLTGATTTTIYTTDSSDLTLLENIALSGNNTGILDDIDTYRTQEAKNMYMRARVIRSGETQFTQNIIIHKRETQNNGSTLTLRRASSGLTYTLTGNLATDKQPFVGDTIFWTPSFTNTTTITNDTRPDYYWFSFDSNSGPNYRNSILSDPANPRNPVNARSYTVQSSDLGGPIVCTMRGINTNPNESIIQTGTVFISTRDVSDGSLTAPQNLVLSYSNLNLVGTWDAAGGGNDTTITYTWYLERSVGGGSYFQVASGNTTTLTFSSSQTTAGRYRFYIVASQTGNPNVTSGFSNVYELQAPAAFTGTVQNVTQTETYRPSIFSVNAPTLSTSILNRWDWTWGGSTITGPAYAKTGSFNITSINQWASQLTRPDGSTNNATVSTTTDWWTVTSNGNHTETVTANNNRKNFVRISWTKPVGTSAASYRISISAYSASTGGSIDWQRVINVEDVTFVDIEHDYAADGAWTTGQTVRCTSILAYNGPNQTGVSTPCTLPAFNQFGADGTTDWSACNVIGTRQASRTDFLQLENPTRGFLSVSGTYEPNEVLSITEGSGWSPSYSSTAWVKTYSWTRSGTVSPVSAGTAATVTTASNSVGDRYSVGVDVTYKGTSYGTAFGSMSPSTARIVPKAPVFSLVDNLNQTFSVPGSFISAVGASTYYGTYSGASSGTVSQTAIGSTFTSPTVNTGNINVTLNSRATVNLVWPTTQNGVVINSNNSTTNSVTISQPPQAQGQRRFLSSIYNVVPGTVFYVSSNGYLGLQATTVGSSFTPPSNGSWLNIAAADLVTQYVYSLADANGLWVRYRGNRFQNNSAILEYQAYYPYNSNSVYVLFLENSIPDYLANNAFYSSGVVQRTWTQSVADTSSFTQLIGTGSMTLRSVTAGTADDGVYQFTVTAPAIPMTSNPTVTRTAGGFTFNITNQSTGTFESAATYNGTITSHNSLATPSFLINSSTGLVTLSGMSSNSTATIRIDKTRSGYESTNISVTGQALAGSPPSQVTAPSFSTSGTVDGSGTVRRAQVNAVLTRAAGTYNNEQSKTTALLTILSNSYTGADSNWTSAGDIGASVTISNSAASASANMYRVRDRVTGTDGSVVDFYSSVIYRAVYAPPPGSITVGTNSATINYTGGSGPQRYYRYQDNVELGFITDSGAGPFATVFSNLTSGVQYLIQLFGGNTEGYLSIGAVGGFVTPTSPNLGTPTITGASQSGGPSTTLTVTVTSVSGAGGYQIWWQADSTAPTATGFDGASTSTTITDPSGPGSAGTWYVFARAVSNTGNTGLGPSSTIGAWSSARAFTVSGGGGGVPSVPTSVNVSGSGLVTWSHPGATTFNIEFFTAQNGTGLNAAGPFTQSTTTNGSYQLTSPYASPNNWARVRVRANNGGANISAYSAWSPSETTYN